VYGAVPPVAKREAEYLLCVCADGSVLVATESSEGWEVFEEPLEWTVAQPEQ